MQTRGQRENGEVFLADVFFSTYRHAAGPRLAALLVDASEHLREREEASLQQLLAGSRILVAAVSHEVRNVCGAIGVMHENLARQGAPARQQDFEALGSLVETLAKIASLELKQSTGSGRAGLRGSARSAHRSANRAGAVLRGIRNRAALGRSRRICRWFRPTVIVCCRCCST